MLYNMPNSIFININIDGNIEFISLSFSLMLFTLIFVGTKYIIISNFDLFIFLRKILDMKSNHPLFKVYRFGSGSHFFPVDIRDAHTNESLYRINHKYALTLMHTCMHTCTRACVRVLCVSLCVIFWCLCVCFCVIFVCVCLCFVRGWQCR